MASFAQILERMNEERSIREQSGAATDGADEPALLDSGEQTEVSKLIDIGKNLNSEFWDNLIKICNNTEALAELLGARADQVETWAANIKQALSKAEEDEGSEKKKMVSTGNDGPMAEPAEAGSTLTHPGAFRPMT
jgi:hypothetical protein